jgi:4-hydroxybenzoyl-CoA thioesterase/acyl-CoA thioester hydrolase
MPEPFRTTRRVEFHDTDMAGIAHFTALFRYMEAAEHDFLRHHGIHVISQDAEGTISWPRVSAACDFRGAARYEDVLAIAVTIERLGDKSITYQFDIACDSRPIAQGRMTSVCCRMATEGPPTPISIPERILEKLAPRAN